MRGWTVGERAGWPLGGGGGGGEKVLSLLQGKANACSNAISSPCGGAHPHVELAQAIMGASSPLPAVHDPQYCVPCTLRGMSLKVFKYIMLGPLITQDLP